MGNVAVKKASRNSSIELLKIFAIVIIVLSHVTQDLIGSGQAYLISPNATADPSALVILLLRSFSGIFGNSIFFICSAWFLLEEDRVSKTKLAKMLSDIWFISVAICLIVLVLRRGRIGGELLIREFFPTLFSNNWYTTCYLLFYLIHGFLNKIIKSLDQSGLLLSASVLAFLYLFCNFIKMEVFYSSDLIIWVAIYFVIAYCKFYLPDALCHTKRNLFLSVGGLAAHALLVAGTNFLGLHIPAFANKPLHWMSNCNPFLLLSAFCLFNLVRQTRLENKAVNYLSKLSLFIYIIHENRLFITYYRPALWPFVYEKFGYDHLFMWVFVLTLGLFLFSAAASILYHHTLEKLAARTANWAVARLETGCHLYETAVRQWH